MSTKRRGWTKLTDELKKQIVAYKEAGKTNFWIHNKMKIGLQNVRTVAYANGFAPDTRGAAGSKRAAVAKTAERSITNNLAAKMALRSTSRTFSVNFSGVRITVDNSHISQIILGDNEISVVSKH